MLAFYKRNPSQWKLRRKTLDYAASILKEINLASRSRQITNFIIDLLLLKSETNDLDKKMLCLATIYIVIKLEGDFTDELTRFHAKVKRQSKQFQIDFRETETTVFKLLSNDFWLAPTFSDINSSLIYFMSQRLTISSSMASQMLDNLELLNQSGIITQGLLSCCFACFSIQISSARKKDELAQFLNDCFQDCGLKNLRINPAIVARFETEILGLKEPLKLAPKSVEPAQADLQPHKAPTSKPLSMSGPSCL